MDTEIVKMIRKLTCDVSTSIEEALIKLLHSCTQEKFVISFACPYYHRIFSVTTPFFGFDFQIFLAFYGQLFRNSWRWTF